MRTLKFRVYDKKENVWIHGPGKEVNLFGETIILGAFLEGVKLERLNDLVALQFTGLLDNNGKEIYEGDIVSDGSIIDEHGCFHKAKVDFKYAGFVVEAINCKCGECAIIPLSQEADNLKVIGNIYENPELLTP